jgi:protein-S-isoprenylcysteine O-methyltransferase Ste14
MCWGVSGILQCASSLGRWCGWYNGLHGPGGCMKVDFPFYFYVLTVLLSIGSLVSGNLTMLGIGLLFAVIAILIEREKNENTAK